MKTSNSLKNLAPKVGINLAIFDFDGTLTKQDSLLAFIKFTHGKNRLYRELFLLSPQLVLMKLGFGNNEYIKTKLLARLYQGVEKEKIETWAEKFCKEHFATLLRPSGLARIRELQRQNYRIILVTASVETWVKPFAKKMGLELIGTKFLFKEQIFTGRLSTPNCRGIEKVNRLKDYLQTTQLPPYLMYGDTEGDQALYQQATKYYHRYFHKKISNESI